LKEKCSDNFAKVKIALSYNYAEKRGVVEKSSFLFNCVVDTAKPNFGNKYFSEFDAVRETI
jgi:hypothetical protein